MCLDSDGDSSSVHYPFLFLWDRKRGRAKEKYIPLSHSLFLSLTIYDLNFQQYYEKTQKGKIDHTSISHIYYLQ